MFFYQELQELEMFNTNVHELNTNYSKMELMKIYDKFLIIRVL